MNDSDSGTTCACRCRLYFVFGEEAVQLKDGTILTAYTVSCPDHRSPRERRGCERDEMEADPDCDPDPESTSAIRCRETEYKGRESEGREQRA